MRTTIFGGTLLCFALLLVFGLQGCFYDNEEDIYPFPYCDTSNVTYSGTIAPIIENRCFDCHSDVNSSISGVSWEGYANLSSYVGAAGGFGGVYLLESIKHENDNPMPKGRPKLSDCEILKIETWINQGFPNN